jgi:NAD(P)-dependent dehydrogenase (short-subunit alcohol dehydrogenase family)
MKKLKEKIENEQGHLDILVNDIWGGEGKTPWNTPIWEQPIELGLKVLRNATESHIITNHFLLPLLIKKTGGILFEISDGILEYNLTHYRCNNLFYDLSKLTANRLAWTMAQELKPFRCTSIGLTPGWLRSEMMLEGFGVTEENWKDAIKQEPGFINSETTRFVGRAIVNIAVDPEVQRFNGKYLNAYDASQMYDFTDLDGTTPNCWDKGTD